MCVCAGVHARLCLFHVCECRAFRYNMLLLKLPLQAPIVSSNRVVFWRVCRSDDVRARECAVCVRVSVRVSVRVWVSHV